MPQLLLFMKQIRYRITKVVCRLISKCTSQAGLLDDICISKERAQFCFALAVIPIIGGMSSKVCKFLIERNIFGSSVRPAHQYRVDSSQSPSSE